MSTVDTPISVAMLSPSAAMGGAERWMITLIDAVDPRRVRWLGLALTPDAPVAEGVLAELERRLPVVRLTNSSAGPLQLPPIIRDAELILTWGIGELEPFVEACSGTLIHVAHSSSTWGEATRAPPSSVRHVAVSTQALDSLHPRARAGAQVLFNGVDEARCRPIHGREIARARWGIGADEIAMGFVGRFDWRKDPLAAARAVAALGPGHVPVYVGEGSFEPRLGSALARLAPRSLILPPSDEIGDVLAGLDVLILASLSEAFSMTITEAWHAGVPVVATRVGAIPELERSHGQLVSGVDLGAPDEAIAAAIRRALQPEFHATVERAQALARRELSLAQMGARWTAYLCATGSRAGAGAHG